MILRMPCVCGCLEGCITERGGQDVVRCTSCDRYQYNAPRTETGKKQRSVSTTHAAIKPKQRTRILARASARCEICGASGILHVSHVLSVQCGHEQGLSDAEINNDENLISSCEECNLGLGDETLPARLLLSIIKARTK